ncbi:MAG TPA: 16S rRNA (adenine(1518)-N(6)/adenine(1519)-N(6))-dimethyltransferase RsmA [Gammaproteobacteria bacterium]|nr:16S rRNA (adenine(1518)-N(6)/adenine(1519)-N(6))-dimethyltransferase RsmA [Gammaproteobacteria bacterium]
MDPRARKRLGQHFLHDPAVVAKIVREIAPRRSDRIVEIGGGLGALTFPLLEHVDELHVVELDERLADELERRRPAGGAQLIVHRGDALEFDLSTLSEAPRSLRVVGNLPYNISTPLLFHLLAQRALIADMIVMVQKEVARRIVAAPGSKDYGRLTVMLAAWLDAKICFDIGPGAFKPPPRVWSTVMRLTPRERARFAVDDERRYAELVRRAFSMRRKTLRRGLAGLLTAEQIESTGVDPMARAETLSPAQLAALAALLTSGP